MGEKYYKCPRCGDLATESQMLKNIEQTGQGDMCFCEFDNERTLMPYVEITLKEYMALSLE